MLVSWAQKKSDYKKLYCVQKTPRKIQYSCTTLPKNTKHLIDYSTFLSTLTCYVGSIKFVALNFV